MICRKCNMKNLPTARYCSSCGADLRQKWQPDESMRISNASTVSGRAPSPEEKPLVRKTPAPKGLFVAKLFAILAAAAALAGVFLPLTGSGGDSVSLWSMALAFHRAMDGSVRGFCVFVGFSLTPLFALFSFLASFFRTRSAFVLAVCGIVAFIGAFLILGDIMGVCPSLGEVFRNIRIGLILFLAGLAVNIVCSLGDAK